MTRLVSIIIIEEFNGNNWRSLQLHAEVPSDGFFSALLDGEVDDAVVVALGAFRWDRLVDVFGVRGAESITKRHGDRCLRDQKAECAVHPLVEVEEAGILKELWFEIEVG